MTKKVCISGYYGFDNFGDETILQILVEELKKTEDKPEITVFSSNPAKTARYLEVRSTYTFNIKSVIEELKNCDCLISGGGSLLQDKTSVKSLLYYLFVIFTARFFKKKTIIFAQGIGPVKNKFLKFITMQLLKRAELVTVRDDNSYNLLKKYKIDAIKSDDPVWNINITPKKNRGKIGIQLREFSNLREDFLDKLCFCINKYYSDKEIYLLSLQNSQDYEICNEMKSKLISVNPHLIVKVADNTSNEKVIKDITELETLIAMRYHACLIAIKADVKLLPVSYDIKVETLAKDFGLDYIDLNNTSNTEEIFEKFVNANINYDKDKIKSLSYNFDLLKQILRC